MDCENCTKRGEIAGGTYCKDFPCPKVAEAFLVSQEAVTRRGRQRATMSDFQLLVTANPENLVEAGFFDQTGV